MAVNADIEAKATLIRQAEKGKDVREALASSVEAIDEVAEDTKSRQDTVEQDFTDIQNSETTRVTAEESRQSSETNRENAESARETAENARASAETTRENNETNRQSNETSRENIINAMEVCETYNPTHTYFLYNKTIYQGSTFQCINTNVNGITGVIPTNDGVNWICIALKGQDGAGGDMFKSTYDTNNNGIVDNTEQLGGQLPSYYAKANDLSTHETDSNAHGINLKANQSDLYTIKIRGYMGV